LPFWNFLLKLKGYVKLEATDKKTHALAKSVCRDTGMKNVHFWVDSNAKEMNAGAMGSLFLPQTVVLTKGLIDKKLPDILMKSVIAHEFGHLKLKHNIRLLVEYNVVASVLDASKIYFEDMLGFNSTAFISGSKVKVIKRAPSENIVLNFFNSIRDRFQPLKVTYSWTDCFRYLLVIVSIEQLFEMIQLHLRRGKEFDADEFAGRLYGPKAGILLEQAIHGYPLWLIRLQMWFWCLPHYVFEEKGWFHRFGLLFSSHPGLSERIKKFEELEVKMRKEKLEARKSRK
jgi:Zn-dependent protease with chaperone function